MIFIIMLTMLCALPHNVHADEKIHHAAPVGAYGGRMNPDVSAIINMWAVFTDKDDDPYRDKLTIQESELAFQAYLYPSIRGDIIIAMHEHDGEWEVHPEETYISFLDLPLGLQVLAGRRLLGFGRLNPVHPHHWKFAHTPLVMSNFFGDHEFFDDGVQLDWLLPNPWDLYFKIAFGHWTGETLGHGGEDEHDGEHDHDHHAAQTLHWRGKIYNGRASVNIQFGELSDILVGYSAVWDEGYNTQLHGGDMTITYRPPMSYKRIRWQSEMFYANSRDEHLANPFGMYSMLSLTWNQYWEIGARYDWSEFFDEAHEQQDGETEEEEENQLPARDGEWGITGFLTYYMTHSLYLRLEYTYSADRFDIEDNRVVAQIVWGLGPHAHRLED